MSDKFMGVQLGSHSVFDEGVEHCLDTLQETANINAVFAYATTYQGFAKERRLGALAHDHGAPLRDPAARNLTRVWFTPHEEYYANTFLRHDAARREGEYAGRDVLAELVEPTRKRGIRLYARILEGFARDLPAVIPNWVKVLAVDVYGRPSHLPCWNHPDYRHWWVSTVEDLFKSYPLDGFKYGSERSGPLSNVLMGAYHGGVAPICFCDHCQAKGRAKGINVERARRGFQELYELISGVQAGKPLPVEGVLISMLRLWLKYPEILAWEHLWHESKEEVAKLIYGAIKAIKPSAQVGWHIYHNGANWDLIYRAETDYAEMASYADWLKPVVYHDIAGPRIRRDVGNLHQRVLKELPERAILELIYDAMGLDKAIEPELDELAHKGLSPDYVYRQTKRCVDAVKGRIPIYPGLGFDIPWENDHFPSDPKTVYQAALKAFEAGAKGLVISREYDEMRLDNLRAVGRALRDANAAGL
jgi:hypothetical protein